MGYDPSKPLVSVHVPKCAGSSFRAVLEEWFGERLAYHYPHVRPDPQEVWDRACAEGGWCIHGHFHETGRMTAHDHYPRATQLITFLRNPLEINVSFLHFVRERYHNKGVQVVPDDQLERLLTIDIDEWIAEEESMLIHSLPSEMNEQNYREVLDRTFLHIGVVEQMDQGMASLARLLGKPEMEMPVVNTTPREHEPSAWAVARFQERNRLAHAVYEYALERSTRVSRSRTAA